MSDMRYFGRYATFRSTDKKSGVVLTNANNLIGDEFQITFKVKDGETVAWAVNKFGEECGFFDKQVTYLLDVTRSRGWTLHALLATVGITDYIEGKPDEKGFYWGEVAIIAFAPKYEDCAPAYLEALSKSLIEGVRLDVDLVSSSIDTLIKSKGAWVPKKKMPPHPKKKGQATVKTTRHLSEKAIEQGRKGNIGCYIVSYAFIGVIVLAVLFLIKTLMGL